MKLPRCHCEPLIKAIDAYIRKADDDLADALKEEGYVEPEETVKRINRLEDAVAEALIAETNLVVSSLKEFQEHPDDYVKHVEESLDLEIYAAYVWPDVKLTDELKPALISIFKEQFRTFMPYFVKRYIGSTDQSLGDVWDVIGPEGNGGRISKRTVAWIESWSEQLAEIMRLNSHTEIENILKKGLKEGVGIEEFTRRILASGIRDERYKARRVAVTEVLTAHRMAQQEAFMQSPSVMEKMWKHTGAYRNEPRENHVRMDGEKVPKAETFRLTGADGHTYFPIVPGDINLPASERINCHCTIQPVSDESILGMSLEERKKLQQQAIDEMDDDWERELDARNRAKAGIDVPANSDAMSKPINDLPDDEGEEVQRSPLDNTTPISHTEEEYRELRAYAKANGIRIQNVNAFDGDSAALRDEIDAIAEIRKEFSISKKAVITFRTMDSGDFAETNHDGTVITLNRAALRDRSVTEAYLNEDNYLAATNIKGIAYHEMGHVISKQYGEKGLAISRQAFYNVFGREPETQELLQYLVDNISEYSVYMYDGKGEKRFKEITPEILSRDKTNATAFSNEFVRLLKEAHGL